MKTRKILYSPGYGAGWTSWNDGEIKKYMLTYEPIIKAIEAGQKINEKHPAVLQLQKECLEKFNKDYVCVLGADDLKVMEVAGRVRISEYDGSESVTEEGTDNHEWM
jgi:hypothetical protein